jgi:hypothetical protein
MYPHTRDWGRVPFARVLDPGERRAFEASARVVHRLAQPPDDLAVDLIRSMDLDISRSASFERTSAQTDMAVG